MIPEHAARIARAQALMAQADMDALLLANGPNLFYFTGFPRARAGSRPYLLLIPQAGAPVFFIHAGREEEVRAATAVTDIHVYHGLSVAPVAEVADLMVRGGYRRVGMELSQEHYLDMQVADFQRLQQLCAGVNLVDAASLLWDLRMVKSAAEIDAIRRACAITGRAYDQVFGEIQTGMREAEIEARMLAAMLLLGGADPWVLITSGTGAYGMVSKGGTARRIEPGEMVWMDAGCTVEGYYADFSRAGVVGEPSPEQRAAQQTIHAITRAGLEAIRPGVPAAVVAQHCQPLVDALTFEVTSRISDLADRVGHGLGLALTEWPSLDATNACLLQPGMVLTAEPGVAAPFGVFHVEENVVVTATGYETLSTCSWELRTLG
jgi:Xaa-Pro aminopeptidase